MIPTVVADLLPGPAESFAAAQTAADVAALPHCRTAIEAALGNEVPDHGRELTEFEELQCAFAEQFAFSVASLQDRQVSMLLEHQTEAEVWAFVVAVYEIDMDVRLGLVAGRVL
ncbi:MAG: hypothetical protein Q7T55_19720 [Solirubrobacteraceae bacterium]|nr:hypothetical protein [Solirubrobacteraceae bacterium]